MFDALQGRQLKCCLRFLQVVLKRCNNVDRALVESKITEFAGRGYRALGLARAKGEGGEPSVPAPPLWIRNRT